MLLARNVVTALAIVSICIVATPAFALDTSEGVVSGAGDWKPSDASAAPAFQRWQLDVTRDADGWVRGRVSVQNSPVLSEGNVEGRFVGDHVSGTVSDDQGARLLTFDGQQSGSGLQGTYTDQTGEAGAWVWDGPPPQ